MLVSPADTPTRLSPVESHAIANGRCRDADYLLFARGRTARISQAYRRPATFLAIMRSFRRQFEASAYRRRVSQQITPRPRFCHRAVALIPAYRRRLRLPRRASLRATMSRLPRVYHRAPRRQARRRRLARFGRRCRVSSPRRRRRRTTPARLITAHYAQLESSSHFKMHIYRLGR